jgi:hypothetical protein
MYFVLGTEVPRLCFAPSPTARLKTSPTAQHLQWKKKQITVGKTKRVAEPRRAAKQKRGTKNKRAAKYIHPTDKWISLRAKMRQARLREEGLVRANMADFMHKALHAYTAEHPSKYVVEQESHTPVEVPAAVRPKRESRDDDGEGAETIDLRKLGTILRFRNK